MKSASRFHSDNIIAILILVQMAESLRRGRNGFLGSPALESGYGLLSNRFCVARNSAEGGFGGCAREFAIRID